MLTIVCPSLGPQIPARFDIIRKFHQQSTKQPMSGTIVRAHNWDVGYEQRFLAVNPLGDEIIAYQTNHDDPGIESNDIVKVHSQTGIEHIQCMSYLRAHLGWTGVGTMDGTVHIFDITKRGAATLRLRSKPNRPCNSLSFNDGALVAASFDKCRLVNSLQVWDISRHARLFTDSGEFDESHAIGPHYSYLANDATLSTVFNRSDPSGMLLMAGGYKLLREFDLRDSSPTPIYQVATKCTMGLTLDHFQPHMFASLSEEGSVSVWDRRKLTGKSKGSVTSENPVLHLLLSDLLRRKPAPCFRYLSIRRGEFAAVLSGNFIRRWNTGCVPKNDSILATFSTNSDLVSSFKQQSMKLFDPSEDLLFAALVLDSKTDWERVISFDYSPDTSSATSTNFVCMREKGTVFRMPVVESIESLDFNSYNEFSMAGPEGTLTKFLDGRVLSDPKPLLVAPVQASVPNYDRPDFSEEVASTIGDEESTAPVTNAISAPPTKMEKMYDDDDGYVPLRRMLDLSQVMQNDICCTIRQRALQGYGVNCTKNVEVLVRLEAVGASLLVRNTWRWLELAKKSLDKGTMVSEGVDLGYIGVLGMWKGVEELQGQNRATLRQQVNDHTFSNAVKAIVSHKGEKSSGISIYSTSDRKMQRKLCLIVSGWYLTEQEFDEKLNQLVEDGYVEKAAGWAVFHDNVPRAIEILALSKKERLQLMSTAVAGYLANKNSNVNLPWNDQCRRLALELDHPYLRAIFAFIADNDWSDVLDENALPLRERLGIALRFLSDKDLNIYLNNVADTVIARGELEGLILTGLTPRGIDLLQSYVDRTSDVQSAALMAQFAVPRYFKDSRVDHWIDCYRNLLNSWGLFKTRARFDVARTKLSKTVGGAATMRSAPRQVFLQCMRCNKNMSAPGAKIMKNPAHASLMLKQFNRLSLKGSAQDYKLCPHCGSPLPRCAICLLTLGTLIPHTTEPDEASVLGQLQRNFNNKFSFCLSCHHGYHAHHAEEWFSKHYVCPVPDCNCRCNSK